MIADVQRSELRGRSLASMLEYSIEEVAYILDVAGQVKRERAAGEYPRRLQNTNIALIFLKPSCRTRMSFVVAAADEGAHLEIFPAEDIRFGIKESPRNVARVLGRLFDGIAFRGFDHRTVEEMVEHAGIPVWNGLCDLYHPTQVLADLFTIRELFGTCEGVSIAYVGDGRNNQARSLMIGAAKTGLDLRVLSPTELQPAAVELEDLIARAGGGRPALVTDDPGVALDGAAVVYGDVWVSMGEEDGVEERIRLLRHLKVTSELMSLTGRADSVYLHCLPAFHSLETSFARRYPDVCEVDDAVFEGPQSRVFDLAENRMHVIKALMLVSVARSKW